MRKFILLASFILFISLGIEAATSPKREMRSGWLTTVWGIDWPSAGTRGNPDKQKEELSALLDNLKATNLNSVFFQTRARADAFYESSFEPWSVDITGSRGTDPGYDPLAYAVEEAHKRGMEIHTWINPYRFESNAGDYTGKPGDYKTTNPEWVLKIPTAYSNGVAVSWATILDPGNPNVRQRIVDIISEIATKYDIDGVVFDDYFYISGITDQDSLSQRLYKPASMSLADWRRENVNLLIADVNTAIKAIKPYLLFGVGPRGYWSTKQDAAEKYGVTLPQAGNGSDTYNDIYCDALAWLKEKTIDYVSPQIYWATTSAHSYTVLCKWWSDIANKFERQIYVSEYLSEINYPTKSISATKAEEVNWGGLSQIEQMALMSKEGIQSSQPHLRANTIPGSDFLLQIGDNRRFDKNGAPGSVFYSCYPLRFETRRNLFLDNVFQNIAIRPTIWSPNPTQGMVSNIQTSGTDLTWDYAASDVRYVVYAIPNSEINNSGLFGESTYIVGITYGNKFEIPSDKPSSNYTYAVSVLDRFGNEFTPFIQGSTIKNESPVTLLSPETGKSTTIPFNFTWSALAGVDYYIFELAEDAAFTEGIYKRPLTVNQISSSDMEFLDAEKEYYWRVTAVKASTIIAPSTASTFKTDIFKVVSPTSGETVTNTPTVKWSQPANVEDYVVQISTTTAFASYSMVYDTTFTADINQLVIPDQTLLWGYTYYLRVGAVSNGVTTYTNVVTMNVEKIEPPVPVILTPADGETIADNKIQVTWEESPYADQFRVELSTSASFFPAQTKTISAFNYTALYENLTDGDYYLRVRARFGKTTNTAWSQTTKVTIKSASIKDDFGSDFYAALVSNNGADNLEISLPSSTKVSISIYSLSGAKVEDIILNQTISGGVNRFILPNNLVNGIYIINIVTDKGNNPIKWIK